MFNARSVINKWFDVCSAIQYYNAKIIVMMETWLSQSSDSPVYTYKDFTKFTAHRQDKSGGGVMCLLDASYQAEELAKPAIFPNSCECIILRVDSLAMVLVALYRPPSCSTTETLYMLSAIEEIIQWAIIQQFLEILTSRMFFGAVIPLKLRAQWHRN